MSSPGINDDPMAAQRAANLDRARFECPFDTILARTPYLVIPKLAIQAMTPEWRKRFARLLDEAANTGLVTPGYFVLRSDAEYTRVIHEDDDDPLSQVSYYEPLRPDPWANYRHGDVRDLCPEWLGMA